MENLLNKLYDNRVVRRIVHVRTRKNLITNKSYFKCIHAT